MKLDLRSLENALISLERACVRARENPADEELRDAVILRFEYSYELCWKMLKRLLENISPSSQAIDTFSFKDLIRDSAERGIIQKVESWFSYRETRNKTSHAYDAKSAQEVFKVALEFLPDAKRLLEEIKKRNQT